MPESVHKTQEGAPNVKRTIIVATGNKEKMVEIRQIITSKDIELITMKDAGVDIEIEETGATFEENAVLKARAVAAASGCLAIADDSGLEVDAMPGELGIHSARWMGHDTSYDIKNAEIIRRVDEYCAQKENGTQEMIHTESSIQKAIHTEPSIQGTTSAEDDIQRAILAEPGTQGNRHPGCEADGTPGPMRSARFVCAVAAVWPDGRERTARGVLEGRINTEQKGFNGFGYDPIFYLPEYGTTSGDIPREEKSRISHRGQAFRKLQVILEEEC